MPRMSTSFKDPSLFPIKGFQHGELFSMQTARHDKAAIRTNAAMQRSKCARPMPHRDTTTGRARQLDSGRSRLTAVVRGWTSQVTRCHRDIRLDVRPIRWSPAVPHRWTEDKVLVFCFCFAALLRCGIRRHEPLP